MATTTPTKTTTPESNPLKGRFSGIKTTTKTFNVQTGDKDSGYSKIALVGPTGTGKTRTVKGLLENGERVFVVSTDYGGSGLDTVRNELRREGKTDLLENLTEIEINSHEVLCDFIEDPQIVSINGLSFWDWSPTVLFWDGVSNWQMNILDEYILDMRPGTQGSSEARLKGLRAEQQDWDSIRRGTARTIHAFMGIHGPSSKVHKFLTFYEKEPEEDKATGEYTRAPMLQGGAKAFTPGAFDLIIYTQRVGKGENIAYEYVMNSTKHRTKTRGYAFRDREPADMKVLWAEIQRQRATTAK